MSDTTVESLVKEPLVTTEEACDSLSPRHAALARISGIDLARAVAVLGMIVVNYHSIFLINQKTPAWFVGLAHILYGRAAGLFVMLAGVGVVLMTRRARLEGNVQALQRIRLNLVKRSMVLFGMGFLLYQVWNADILQFYCIFLSTGALLLTASNRQLLWTAGIILSFSAVIFCLSEGDPGLQWCIPASSAFIETVDGFILSGYYPVFPWLAFFLAGMWLGRMLIEGEINRKKNLFQGALLVLAASEIFNHLLSGGVYEEGSLLEVLTVSSAFPTSPLFAVSVLAEGIVIILLSLYMAERCGQAWWQEPLMATGKLSLTIYILHLLIGFEIQESLAAAFSGVRYTAVSVGYILSFLLLSVCIATLWSRYFRKGPFEWLMRVLAG